MKIFSVFFYSFLVLSNGFSEPRFQNYISFISQSCNTLGPIGNHENGEIELVLTPLMMEEIERNTSRTVGIIAEDNYWIWLNDPVRYPWKIWCIRKNYLEKWFNRTSWGSCTYSDT